MTTVDQKDPGQRPYLDYSSNPPPPSYNDVMYYYSQPPPPPPPPNASVSLPGHDSADVLHGRNELFFMESMGDAPRAGLMMQMGESSDIAAVRAQGLSLSLGSELPMPSFLYRPCSEGFFPASHHSSAESNHLREKSFADPSPHGLSSLAGSRYLMAAQELLDEAVNVRSALKNRSQKRDSDWRSPCEELPSHPAFDLPAAERQELQSKMAKLMAMLDQVDRKYKHYHQQMQIVVSSFDSVVGAGAAKPYTGLALQTISRQFRALRDAINGQLSTTRRTLGEKDPPTVRSGGVPRLRCVDQQIRDQRAFQQQAWRPQRGLPETSVSILRAWLFEHFLHPYPKDSDKLMLASQTGLTRSQVSNWFINARVRLWKPMIEEMYEEERKEAETELADENSAAGSSSAGKPQSFADDCDLLPEEATAQADVNSRYMPVRLTLGLRHGEGGLLAPSRVNQTSPIDGNAAEYVVDRRDRFGAVPLLHDFVAM